MSDSRNYSIRRSSFWSMYPAAPGPLAEPRIAGSSWETIWRIVALFGERYPVLS